MNEFLCLRVFSRASYFHLDFIIQIRLWASIRYFVERATLISTCSQRNVEQKRIA